jgi:hypothetical protein
VQDRNSDASFGIVTGGQAELGAQSSYSIVCISFLANAISQETVYVIISYTTKTNGSYTCSQNTTA